MTMNPRTLALALIVAASGIGSRLPAQPVAGAAQATGASVGNAFWLQPILDTATFAGGCFWCMEPPFDKLPGVVSTTSGYMGGTVPDPTYEQVSAGGTRHAEVVQVIFDPARVTYARLLDVFWRNIDPITPNRQFCDGGDQYRSAIFYHDEAQQAAARTTKADLDGSKRFNKPIVTEVVAAARFYPAEAYHQDYYTKNPIRYKFYRGRCGRDDRLAELWGKPAS